MKSRIVAFALSSSFLVAGCIAQPATEPTPPNEEAATAGGKSDSVSADNWTYFTARPDLRKCMAPLCGGYWVKRVNQPKTKCIDGSWQKECYVADLDWSSLGLSDVETADANAAAQAAEIVLRGKLAPAAYPQFDLASFAVEEGWRGATSNAPSGTFYRVKDSGVKCITYPCPTVQGVKLNKNAKPISNYSGLDLAPSGASQEQIDQAWQDMTGPGLVVAATTETVTGPAGKGTGLTASQFYTRIAHVAATGCHTTGCSGEICAPADQNIMSICVYKAEYACYQKLGTCEVQPDGSCGFTPTAELKACLSQYGL